MKRRDEDSYEATLDAQMFEAERVRLSLLEEKIKEVLEMLRSLNAMVRLWTPILLNQHITQSFLGHFTQNSGQTGFGCGRAERESGFGGDPGLQVS